MRVFVVIGVLSFEALFESPDALAEGMPQFREAAMTEEQNDERQDNQMTEAKTEHS